MCFKIGCVLALTLAVVVSNEGCPIGTPFAKPLDHWWIVEKQLTILIDLIFVVIHRWVYIWNIVEIVAAAAAQPDKGAAVYHISDGFLTGRTFEIGFVGPCVLRWVVFPYFALPLNFRLGNVSFPVQGERNGLTAIDGQSRHRRRVPLFQSRLR